MRLARWFLLWALSIAAAAGFDSGNAGKNAFLVPRRAFADLLKIPLEPPDVNPTVHSRREEGGVIIEDVSWPAIDGEVAPAFVVRPAKANGRLPAVVCLHGTSTNRDVNIAPDLGYAEWARYPSGKKSKTLFGWARELAR